MVLTFFLNKLNYQIFAVNLLENQMCGKMLIHLTDLLKGEVF